MTRSIVYVPVFIIIYLMYMHQSDALAETPEINIEIINHLFIPSEVTIPANTKVKLIIHNHDDTHEEFESHELNREKIIVGNQAGIIFIGPLPPGSYSFEGEFFPKTARGKIIVK